MVNIKYIIIFLIGFFVSYFIFNNKTDTIIKRVYVPSTSSNFDYVNTVNTVINLDSLKNILNTSYNKEEIKEKIKVINLAEKERQELNNKYSNLESKYKRFKLFKNFNSIKEFTEIFEDEYSKSKVEGVVSGELKYLKLETEIKSKEIDIPINIKRNNNFSIGPYIGYDPLLNDYSVGIGIQYSIIKF